MAENTQDLKNKVYTETVEDIKESSEEDNVKPK